MADEEDDIYNDEALSPPEAPPGELPVEPPASPEPNTPGESDDTQQVINRQAKDSFSAALDVGDSIYQYVRQKFGALTSGENPFPPEKGDLYGGDGAGGETGESATRPGFLESMSPSGANRNRELAGGSPDFSVRPDSLGGKLRELLSGAGAAHPENVKKIEQATAQAEGTSDPDVIKTMALAHATAESPELGMGVEQAQRKEYDTYRNFAAVALNGTQKKPMDLRSAALAATMAMPNLANGEKVTFTPTGSGVTAAVTDPRSGRVLSQTPLTVQQFNEFLRGPTGVYDMMKEAGAGATLTKLAQSQGMPVAPITPQPKQQQQAAWPNRGQQGMPTYSQFATPRQAMPTRQPQPAQQSVYDNPIYREALELQHAPPEVVKQFNMRRKEIEQNDVNSIRYGHEWRVELAKQQEAARTERAVAAILGREKAAEIAANSRKYSADVGARSRTQSSQIAAQSRVFSSGSKELMGSNPQAGAKALQTYKEQGGLGAPQAAPQSGGTGGITVLQVDPKTGRPSVIRAPDGRVFQRGPNGEAVEVQANQ